MCFIKQIFIAGLLLSGFAQAAITVDVQKEKQEFLGFGTQMWLGHEELESAFPELGIRWVRLGMTGMKECTVEEPSLPAFYRYFRKAVAKEDLAAAGAMLNRNGAQAILTGFGVPDVWLDAEKKLPSDKLEAFAQMWAGAVRYAVKSGLKPRYLELFNEPDGDWNGGCRPSDYNVVVKLVRKELDALGYTDIEICGPGLAHVDLHGPDKWAESLDADGAAALGAWSLHGFEWHRTESAAAVRDEFKNGFMASVKKQDALNEKPILITEFATFCKTFHDTEYVSPRDAYRGKTAAQHPAWCTRVIENALSFLNEGAHVLVYWQLADIPWEETNFGAYTRLEDGAREQMIYKALKGFFPEVAAGFRTLETVQEAGSPLYAAALKNGSRTVVCVANHSDETSATKLVLNNSAAVRLVRRHEFSDGELCTTTPKTTIGTTMELTIPGDGFVTLVFDPVVLEPTGESTVHLDQPLYAVEGFGVNAWTGDPGALSVMDELGMKWVRLNLEGVRTFDQPDLSAEQIVDYFTEVTQWDRIKYVWAIKKAQGLKFMMVSYGAPEIWMGDGKKFKEKHAGDVARLWAAGMKAYADQGFVPDGIELFNEPDGNWDSYISPKTYNQIVKVVREELDRYGLDGVQIVGPGRAHIDVGGSDEWVDALDEEAVDALGAFSIHSWTWNGPDSHSSDYVRESSGGFMKSANAKDPKRKKLRILTEFLAKDFVIDGVEYGDHAKNFYNTAVDTVPYAVHVIEDLLSHLNAGFNTVLVWQMADQWWESAGWGLMGKMEDGYPRKPIFNALKILLPELTSGFWTLQTENRSGAYVAAFVNRKKVVVAVVNASQERQVQRIQLAGADQAVLFRTQCFDAIGISEELPRETVRGEWMAELPASSVTVAVFDLMK